MSLVVVVVFVVDADTTAVAVAAAVAAVVAAAAGFEPKQRLLVKLLLHIDCMANFWCSQV